jgi:low affinity Fe/Cu permease
MATGEQAQAAERNVRKGIRVAGQGPSPGRSRVSWWLSRVDRHASRPWAAVLVIGAAGTWIIVSLATGFPARWEIIFQTLVAALTLVMVFVIQHTQARHQRATQRKLDEILLAMPGTDNSLLRLEHASDQELRHAGHQHLRARRAALADDAGPGAGCSAEEAQARRPS